MPLRFEDKLSHNLQVVILKNSSRDFEDKILPVKDWFNTLINSKHWSLYAVKYANFDFFKTLIKKWVDHTKGNLVFQAQLSNLLLSKKYNSFLFEAIDADKVDIVKWLISEIDGIDEFDPLYDIKNVADNTIITRASVLKHVELNRFIKSKFINDSVKIIRSAYLDCQSLKEKIPNRSQEIEDKFKAHFSEILGNFELSYDSENFLELSIDKINGVIENILLGFSLDKLEEKYRLIKENKNKLKKELELIHKDEKPVKYEKLKSLLEKSKEIKYFFDDIETYLNLVKKNDLSNKVGFSLDVSNANKFPKYKEENRELMLKFDDINIYTEKLEKLNDKINEFNSIDNLIKETSNFIQLLTYNFNILVHDNISSHEETKGKIEKISNEVNEYFPLLIRINNEKKKEFKIQKESFNKLKDNINDFKKYTDLISQHSAWMNEKGVLGLKKVSLKKESEPYQKAINQLANFDKSNDELSNIDLLENRISLEILEGKEFTNFFKKLGKEYEKINKDNENKLKETINISFSAFEELNKIRLYYLNIIDNYKNIIDNDKNLKEEIIKKIENEFNEIYGISLSIINKIKNKENISQEDIKFISKNLNYYNNKLLNFYYYYDKSLFFLAEELLSRQIVFINDKIKKFPENNEIQSYIKSIEKELNSIIDSMYDSKRFLKGKFDLISKLEHSRIHRFISNSFSEFSNLQRKLTDIRNKVDSTDKLRVKLESTQSNFRSSFEEFNKILGKINQISELKEKLGRCQECIEPLNILRKNFSDENTKDPLSMIVVNRKKGFLKGGFFKDSSINNIENYVTKLDRMSKNIIYYSYDIYQAIFSELNDQLNDESYSKDEKYSSLIKTWSSHLSKFKISSELEFKLDNFKNLINIQKEITSGFQKIDQQRCNEQKLNSILENINEIQSKINDLNSDHPVFNNYKNEISSHDKELKEHYNNINRLIEENKNNVDDQEALNDRIESYKKIAQNNVPHIKKVETNLNKLIKEFENNKSNYESYKEKFNRYFTIVEKSNLQEHFKNKIDKINNLLGQGHSVELREEIDNFAKEVDTKVLGEKFALIKDFSEKRNQLKERIDSFNLIIVEAQKIKPVYSQYNYQSDRSLLKQAQNLLISVAELPANKKQWIDNNFEDAKKFLSSCSDILDQISDQSNQLKIIIEKQKQVNSLREKLQNVINEIAEDDLKLLNITSLNEEQGKKYQDFNGCKNNAENVLKETIVDESYDNYKEQLDSYLKKTSEIVNSLKVSLDAIKSIVKNIKAEQRSIAEKYKLLFNFYRKLENQYKNQETKYQKLLFIYKKLEISIDEVNFDKFSIESFKESSLENNKNIEQVTKDLEEFVKKLTGINDKSSVFILNERGKLLQSAEKTKQPLSKLIEKYDALWEQYQLVNNPSLEKDQSYFEVHNNLKQAIANCSSVGIDNDNFVQYYLNLKKSIDIVGKKIPILESQCQEIKEQIDQYQECQKQQVLSDRVEQLSKKYQDLLSSNELKLVFDKKSTIKDSIVKILENIESSAKEENIFTNEKIEKQEKKYENVKTSINKFYNAINQINQLKEKCKEIHEFFPDLKIFSNYENKIHEWNTKISKSNQSELEGINKEVDEFDKQVKSDFESAINNIVSSSQSLLNTIEKREKEFDSLVVENRKLNENVDQGNNLKFEEEILEIKNIHDQLSIAQNSNASLENRGEAARNLKKIIGSKESIFNRLQQKIDNIKITNQELSGKINLQNSKNDLLQKLAPIEKNLENINQIFNDFNALVEKYGGKTDWNSNISEKKDSYNELNKKFSQFESQLSSANNHNKLKNIQDVINNVDRKSIYLLNQVKELLAELTEGHNKIQVLETQVNESQQDLVQKVEIWKGLNKKFHSLLDSCRVDSWKNNDSDIFITQPQASLETINEIEKLLDQKSNYQSLSQAFEFNNDQLKYLKRKDSDIVKIIENDQKLYEFLDCKIQFKKKLNELSQKIDNITPEIWQEKGDQTLKEGLKEQVEASDFSNGQTIETKKTKLESQLQKLQEVVEKAQKEQQAKDNKDQKTLIGRIKDFRDSINTVINDNDRISIEPPVLKMAQHFLHCDDPNTPVPQGLWGRFTLWLRRMTGRIKPLAQLDIDTLEQLVAKGQEAMAEVWLKPVIEPLNRAVSVALKSIENTSLPEEIQQAVDCKLNGKNKKSLRSQLNQIRKNFGLEELEKLSKSSALSVDKVVLDENHYNLVKQKITCLTQAFKDFQSQYEKVYSNIWKVKKFEQNLNEIIDKINKKLNSTDLSDDLKESYNKLKQSLSIKDTETQSQNLALPYWNMNQWIAPQQGKTQWDDIILNSNELMKRCESLQKKCEQFKNQLLQVQRAENLKKAALTPVPKKEVDVKQAKKTSETATSSHQFFSQKANQPKPAVGKISTKPTAKQQLLEKIQQRINYLSRLYNDFCKLKETGFYNKQTDKYSDLEYKINDLRMIYNSLSVKDYSTDSAEQLASCLLIGHYDDKTKAIIINKMGFGLEKNVDIKLISKESVEADKKIAQNLRSKVFLDEFLNAADQEIASYFKKIKTTVKSNTNNLNLPNLLRMYQNFKSLKDLIENEMNSPAVKFNRKRKPSSLTLFSSCQQQQPEARREHKPSVRPCS